MRLSQKCNYALWAVYELSRRTGEGPLSIASIAEACDIPPMFLQAILREMKQGGFVESRRGKHGGYQLARRPAEISLGQVIRFVDGDLAPVGCVSEGGRLECRKTAACPFLPVWREAADQLNRICDRVTFADLVERGRVRGRGACADYVI